MWAIKNRSVYKVGKTWTRDKDGVHQWIVAVKGTYSIAADGRVSLADDQVDVLRLPEYHGEYGLSSVRYDADLVGPKPTTDVVLNGTAYAPGGRPSTEFLIGLRVGPVEKVLRVRGDRRWGKPPLGVPTAAEPVTTVPVVYERAYGGYDHSDPDPRHHRLDTRNPVGSGVARASERTGLPAPNFEYPNGSLEDAGPAGFGAIDSHWSPRRELMGTYDKAWRETRRPLLAADWDARALLSAPPDQRPDTFLRGGEAVELLNLTPSGRLQFVLPKVHLAFTTYIDRRLVEHRARLATVLIEPDYPRVMMVWVTSLTCRSQIDYLDATVVSEKAFL